MEGWYDFPLSQHQEQVWLQEQLLPVGSAYHIAVAYRLVGVLRPELLRAALQEVVDRHEALRTTITTIDDEPRQLVRPTLPVAFDTAGEGDPEQALAEHRQRPFALDRGPLLRAVLA